MSLQTDIEVLKDIPGYKAILKAVLKTQIQLLIEQLADNTGEESIILTASINDGTLSHLGSSTGKGFLEGREEIKSQFLGYCLKSHHVKKPVVTTSPSFQSRTQSGPQLASRRPRIRPAPYSLTSPGASHSQAHATSSTTSSQRPTPYHQNNTVKSEPSGDGEGFLDKVSGGSEEEYSSGVPGMMSGVGDSGVMGGVGDGEGDTYGDVSGHMSLSQDAASSRDKSRVADMSGDLPTKLEPTTEDDLTMEGSGDGWGQQQAGYSGGDTETAGMAGVQGASGYNSSDQAHEESLARNFDPVGEVAFPGLNTSRHDFSKAFTDITSPELKQALYPMQGNNHPNLFLGSSATAGLATASTSNKKMTYWCEHCNKALQNKALYAYHLRAHNGVKPYECEICHRKFAGKQVLETHMRLHSGEKPFKCMITGCDRAFSARSGLVYHIRKHHNVQGDVTTSTRGRSELWRNSFPPSAAAGTSQSAPHTPTSPDTPVMSRNVSDVSLGNTVSDVSSLGPTPNVSVASMTNTAVQALFPTSPPWDFSTLRQAESQVDDADAVNLQE